MMKQEEVILLESDVVLPVPEKMDVYKVEGNPIRYFLTPESARKHMATHKKCETCEEIYAVRSYCRTCSAKRREEGYMKLPFKSWDYETPLTLYDDDKYFFDQEDLDFYISDNEIDPKDLRLVICKPNLCTTISEEYFADEMPENYDSLDQFDKGLVEKLKDVNEYIKTLRPMSWSAGDFRTEYLDYKP